VLDREEMDTKELEYIATLTPEEKNMYILKTNFGINF
jgi:hypothetical protein